jgi:hypothetical protein
LLCTEKYIVPINETFETFHLVTLNKSKRYLSWAFVCS